MTKPQPGGGPGIDASLRRTQARSFPRHRRARTSGASSGWDTASVDL
jgi:hypothetical protein